MRPSVQFLRVLGANDKLGPTIVKPLSLQSTPEPADAPEPAGRRVIHQPLTFKLKTSTPGPPVWGTFYQFWFLYFFVFSCGTASAITVLSVTYNIIAGIFISVTRLELMVRNSEYNVDSRILCRHSKCVIRGLSLSHNLL